LKLLSIAFCQVRPESDFSVPYAFFFLAGSNIVKLALFGSALREDFGPDSDVDVLVEFESGYAPGFFRLFYLEMELSYLFNGRKVDLRTPEDLSRYFWEDMIAEAEIHYAQE